MTAFLPSPPLPNPRPTPTPPSVTPRCCAPLRDPLPADPLPAFEAFCNRTKTALCTQTAEADGLGTFTTAFSYPSQQPPSETLSAGRRFRASINVFRSPPYKHQSAGLALKLVPHDPTLPSLRADVHYFQTDASWWFSGACDLSAGPAGRLSPYSEAFLRSWEALRERYRATASQRASFLDACYEKAVDRDTAFGFVGDVVERLLPSYLPLLLDTHLEGGAVAEGETCESFCIIGGAACESSTLRKPPFVSWGFSLAPSAMTTAGRVYDTLRAGSVCGGSVYLIR